MRRKLMRWIAYRLFKHDPSTIIDGPLKVIYSVIFPLRAMYERNTLVRRLCSMDGYIIDGHFVSSLIIEGRPLISEYGWTP